MFYIFIIPFIALISACPFENENCFCQKGDRKGDFVFCHENITLQNVVDFLQNVPGPIQALRLFRPNIPTLPADTFKDHVILDLIIEGGGLTTIENGALDALKPNLRRLILPFNKLKQPPDVNGFPMLEDLVLHNNSISTLNENAFQNLPALKTCILSANGLESVPDTAFSNLKQINVLSLAGNKITGVSSKLIDGLVNLQKLFLRDNALSAIDVGTFDNHPNLDHLDLAGNALTEIKKGLIPASEKLIVLDLSNNKISTIEGGAFENLKALKSLVLAENELKGINSDMFSGLENSLAALNLSSVQLSEIPSNIFEKLKSLEELDLSGNNIASLPVDAFTGLTELKALAFGGNPMKEFQLDLLKDSPQFNSLSLANSGLQDIPEGVRKFETLQLLELSGNNIVNLDKSMFENLKNLKVLFLDSNKITDVPLDVFSPLKNLRVLDLSFNQISKITTHAFDAVSGSIVYINLEGNPIDCSTTEAQQLNQALITLKQKYNYMQLMMLPKMFIVVENINEKFPVKRVDMLPCLPPINSQMRPPNFNRPNSNLRRIPN